jgi:hypothetical protein
VAPTGRAKSLAETLVEYEVRVIAPPPVAVEPPE